MNTPRFTPCRGAAATCAHFHFARQCARHVRRHCHESDHAGESPEHDGAVGHSAAATGNEPTSRRDEFRELRSSESESISHSPQRTHAERWPQSQHPEIVVERATACLSQNSPSACASPDLASFELRLAEQAEGKAMPHLVFAAHLCGDLTFLQSGSTGCGVCGLPAKVLPVRLCHDLTFLQFSSTDCAPNRQQIPVRALFHPVHRQ